MSSIHDKISKIIAKANSTNNEAEAEMLMAKAHELLVKHNIELSQIGDHNDPIDGEKFVMASPNSQYWAKGLTHALATYYGCKIVVLWDNEGGSRLMFGLVGRESARVTTKLMQPFIRKQVMAAGRKLAKEMGCSHSIANRQVANALTQRIWQIIHDNRMEVEATGGSKNALVITDAVEAFNNEFWGELGTASTRPKLTSAAAREAANGISINRQAEAQARSAAIGQTKQIENN